MRNLVLINLEKMPSIGGAKALLLIVISTTKLNLPLSNFLKKISQKPG